MTVALIILAGGVFGSEFSWGNGAHPLMAGISRDRFYASKVITLLGIAAVVTAAAAILSLLASLAVGVVVDQSFYTDRLTGSFMADALLMTIRAFIGIGLWVLIASAIALTTHSLAAGVGVTLGLYFGGDIVLTLLGATGDIGRWVTRLFPNEAINALLELNSADPPSYGAGDYAWIITNLVFYTVAAIVIAVIRFRRMDIIAASG
ncbi:MAG: hypothetical protein R2849_18745 [Thermomicrobiales bacterium]